MWNYDEQWVIKVVGPMFFNLYKLKNRVFGDDPESVVWPSRVMVDIYANNLLPQDSFQKHANECADSLGVPRPFKYPSRDQVINVKANFCNLFDNDGWPIFEDFIDEVVFNNPTKADDWAARLKAAGSTHLTLGMSGDYVEDLGWAPRYPVAGSDWTQNLAGFAKILDWVIDKGFIPFIKLPFDGQAYDPIFLTYGWQWGMDNVERISSELSDYLLSCLWSTGFDGCFPDWSADQTIQMLTKMKKFFPYIDTEFGNEYIHMGGGPSDWADDKLGLLDNFSIELLPAPESGAQVDVTGIQQAASRLLGPEKKNISTINDASWYLQNTTKKPNICMFETVAYPISRKRCTSQDAIDVARVCAGYGFKSFGNGQP